MFRPPIGPLHSRARDLDDLHGAYRPRGAAGGRSLAQGHSKKQALQELAARAAAICRRNEREVLEVLMQRERLGSTGIGSGIAIPHGKLAKLERLVRWSLLAWNGRSISRRLDGAAG